MARAAAGSKRARRRSAEVGEEVSLGTRVGSELVGVVLLGGALLASLALATYESSDPVFALQPVANAAGVVGASLAGGLFAGFGYGAIVLVAAVAWIGARLCLQQGLPGLASRFWPGAVLLLLASTTLPPILQEIAPGRLGTAVGGGAVGTWLASSESLLVSRWGALLLNSFLFTLGVLSVLGISTGAALSAIGSGAALTGAFLASGVRLAARGTGHVFDLLRDFGHSAADRVQRGIAALVVLREQRARRRRAAQARASEEAADTPGAQEPVLSVEAIAEPAAKAAEPPPAPRVRTGDATGPDIVDHASERAAARKPEQETFEFEEDRPSGPFKLPDLGIFQRPPEDSRSYDRDSLLMNSRILEKKLQDFGVSGTVVRVHPGPVITMYEYEPAPGVKVNKIVNLSDDLTRARAAPS